MPEATIARQLRDATVLFSGIHNFSSLAEQLNAGEVAELLTHYRELASQRILENGGSSLRFTGQHLVGVFIPTVQESPPPSTRRAVCAALALALVAHELRAWLAQRFPDRALPPFAIGVGLHCGDVTLCRLGTGQNSKTMPIGEAVTIAARLETATQALGWTVAASSAVLATATDDIQTGARTSLAVRGKVLAVDVLEITGLATSIDDKAQDVASLAQRALEIIAAVKINSDISAHAAKTALDSQLLFLEGQSLGLDAAPVRLNGYRIIKKIGSGGMTEVYLAERQSDGLNIVLKVLGTHAKNAPEQLARFVQEYALLSKITHPHIVRLYDQGFTEAHAYIAMEYFERGDLRQSFGPGMTQQRVLGVIKQVAAALDAIHQQDIVHRDIKPENIMQRVDWSVALADFGIAKSMLQPESDGLVQTPHDDVIGTPYYLSPEQVSGQLITPQSDLYSLGVVMFEMLARKRPFAAESLDMLLAQHLRAPTPALPPEHAHLQPIVHKLMHKNLALRYASAQGLLVDLNQLH